MNSGANADESVSVVTMQLIKPEQIYSWVRWSESVSMTQPQVAPRHTGSATSNNQPEMLT